MRREGFVSVLGQWVNLDFNSTHLNPLGGAFTATHVWIVNQLSLRTPLSINDAWGLIRIVWLTSAILSATWCLGRLSRLLSYSLPGPFVLVFILTSSLQVHGYWSNDPVVAFPVASWAFCILGLLYLGALFATLDAEPRSRRIWTVVLLLCSFAGILTYELFAAFLAASFSVQVGCVLIRRTTLRRISMTLIMGTLVPGAFLLVTQIARLAGGSSYSGTAVSFESQRLPIVALAAVVSSVPLAATKLTLTVLPNSPIDPGLLIFFLLGAGALVVLSLLTQRANGQVPTRSRLMYPVVLAGFIMLWISSTLIVVATPKYQGELGGVVGRVYLNYAPSWLAIGFVIHILIGLSIHRWGIKALRLAVGVLLIVGITQAWANSRHLQILEADSSWSSSLLVDLKSAPLENETRCRNVDRLFTLPLPPYYQSEILDGLQLSYSGPWGIPYCDFRLDDTTARPLVRPLSGTFPVEYLPDGRRVIWSNSRDVKLQLINPFDSSLEGVLEMKMSLAPCSTEMDLVATIVRASGNKQFRYSLSNGSRDWVFENQFRLERNESVELLLTQSGQGCRVETDPREFWVMIELPIIRSLER